MDLHDGASHSRWEMRDTAAKLQYNGCLFTKPNHTLLLTQPCTFSSVHPWGAIHCVNDAECLPSHPSSQPASHFYSSQASATLALLRFATLLEKPVGLNTQGLLSLLFLLTCPRARHGCPTAPAGAAQLPSVQVPSKTAWSVHRAWSISI